LQCCSVLRAHNGMDVKQVMKYRARAAMRCNVLQCVVMCCNVLQCVEGTLWNVCKASDEM